MKIEVVKRLPTAKAGGVAGALFVACCLLGPLLVGAACLLPIGLGGELAVAALVAVVALALHRRRRRDGTCC